MILSITKTNKCLHLISDFVYSSSFQSFVSINQHSHLFVIQFLFKFLSITIIHFLFLLSLILHILHHLSYSAEYHLLFLLFLLFLFLFLLHLLTNLLQRLIHLQLVSMILFNLVHCILNLLSSTSTWNYLIQFLINIINIHFSSFLFL